MTETNETHAPMTALVTGASRGIGRAIAVHLARDYGARLMLVYRQRAEDAVVTAEACRAHGAEVELRAADVGSAEAANALVDGCIEQFGRLDVLVNNAAVIDDGLALEMSDHAWRHVLTTNLDGAFWLARAAAKPMLLQKHGRIVNISSVSARRPNRGQVNYAASKGGLEALTRALAVELASKRITVNAVAPGVIETEMSDRVRQLAGREIKKGIPMRRFGTVDDVASVVSFLAGDKAGYVTGQVIGVDGGVGL